MSDVLINKMEAVVQLYVDELVSVGTLVCPCSRCRKDVIALALNSLPPKYVVTDLGEVFTNISLDSSQWRADIMIAVHNALAIVGKTPRH